MIRLDLGRLSRREGAVTVSKGWLLDRMLGLSPASTRDVAVHADIAVPMRDGVVLRVDRYVPAGREDAPVVVVRSPYGRNGLWGRLYCLPLARRGYQVVIQSCRGIEDSEGEFIPFAERDDGYDTVVWLRQQPWYPGRLATFGPSYLGLAQWAVADAAGDELVAMTPVLEDVPLVVEVR
jgi:putative CocE/NonD family hydrolase